MKLPTLTFALRRNPSPTDDWLDNEPTYEVVVSFGDFEVATVPAPGVDEYQFRYGDDNESGIADALAPYFAKLFAQES